MPTTSVRVLWISLFFCFNFEPDCSQHINVLVKFEKLNDKHQATLNYCKIKMNKAQQFSIFFLEYSPEPADDPGVFSCLWRF